MSFARLLVIAGLALLGGVARAQVQLNEVFVSHTGTDNREFIELKGPAGTALTGHMILVVEGDATSNQGGLDIAIDLSAGTIGASGFYTVGSANVVPAVDQIQTGPGTPPDVNLFENGTETIYLIQTDNVGYILSLLGTDLRVTPGSGTATILASPPPGVSITILDLVGLTDDVTELICDGAPTFIDGTFGPAGVVRCCDAPNPFNMLLDFDFVTSPGYSDVTPGASNTGCGTPCVPAATGTPYCFGDGSGTACPCGNASAVGANEGCLNSLGTGGKLTGTGAASIAADTLVLAGAGMPNSSALYFQGTSQQGGGAGAVFGDGLRCAGGTVVRLGTKTNAAGVSQYPAAGDLSVSVRGLVAAPGTRTYQIWYRNAAAFCTASTFNLSNGLEVVWGT